MQTGEESYFLSSLCVYLIQGHLETEITFNFAGVTQSVFTTTQRVGRNDFCLGLV